MFQSTPAIADGRTARPRGNGAGMQAFQSTPAIADGRTAASARRSCRRAGRFNPRPPSLTGEPPHRRSGSAARGSFNPRPPSLTGEPMNCTRVSRSM